MSDTTDKEAKRLKDEHPRVTACIAGVMERFPADVDKPRYYVEVHQALAPLARQLERELTAILAAPQAVAGEPQDLPKLPGHPEPHSYTWTELRAIAKYGEDCARAALAASPQQAPAAPTVTCKGKGGSYVDIGIANGAGTMRGKLMHVYSDVVTGALFFRTLADFAERMDRPAAAPTVPQAAPGSSSISSNNCLVGELSGNGTMEAKEAVEINNTAGKIISSAKVQLAYAALRGEQPNIPFLVGQPDAEVKPALPAPAANKPFFPEVALRKGDK